MTRQQHIKLDKLSRREHYKAERRKIIRKYRTGVLEQQVENYSKKITSRLSTLAITWISILVLALVLSGWLGLSDAALTVIGVVCGAIITEIIIVVWRYMTKAYQGKKAEEEVKLEKYKLNMTNIMENVAEVVTGREG